MKKREIWKLSRLGNLTAGCGIEKLDAEYMYSGANRGPWIRGLGGLLLRIVSIRSTVASFSFEYVCK